MGIGDWEEEIKVEKNFKKRDGDLKTQQKPTKTNQIMYNISLHKRYYKKFRK